MRAIYLVILLSCTIVWSCGKDNVAFAPSQEQEVPNVASITVFVVNQTAAVERDDCGGICNSDNYGVIGANVFLYRQNIEGEIDENFTHHETTNYYGTAKFRDLEIADYMVVVDTPFGQREKLVTFTKGGHKQLQIIF